MAFAFDTLGYAKRLREAGVSSSEAEAHAEAAREFIMAELVTRYDLDTARRELETRIDNRMSSVDNRITELDHRITNLELRLTIRLGGMIALSVAILAAIIKL